MKWSKLLSLVNKPAISRAGIIVLIGALYMTMLSGVVPTPTFWTSTVAADQDVEHYIVVRIRAATPDESQRLIDRGVELLEARDGADLLALVSPDEHAALLADGWQVHIDPEQTAYLRTTNRQAGQPGYRTVEETEVFLQTMAERYPDLATLVDFGDSWEKTQFPEQGGYDLWAIRLTNKATSGPKPVFFLMAAMHARELTTVEIATRFIQHMLTEYGHDPDVTWILNAHEIVVVPIVNPDGRKLAEQGYSQRKNTNDSHNATCATPPEGWSQFGVDLNRNFAFAWGTVNSPALSPCSLVYPGTTAASEPETQALKQFIRELYPNRQPVVEDTTALHDRSGVLISLHSFSDLVIWPWGHTVEPTPNARHLEHLGHRMASLNGYQPMQSIYLYPTSGTTDDWSYAELGLASYTFEVGPASGPCGGFMPPYGCLDGSGGRNFWDENLPALLYAARVARAPYTQPFGPDIRNIRVTRKDDTLTVIATLDGGDTAITVAEMYVAASPGNGGTPLALQPLDGAFDSPIEQGYTVLTPDQHISEYHNPEELSLMLVRARNAHGTWGPMSAAWMRPHHQRWFPFATSP